MSLFFITNCKLLSVVAATGSLVTAAGLATTGTTTAGFFTTASPWAYVVVIGRIRGKVVFNMVLKIQTRQ